MASPLTEPGLMNTFYFTRGGQIIPTIAGTLSAFSSMTIIYIIIRSQSRLATTYHRIMFMISFWDCILSTAYALSTIPMPSDVIYPFEGKSYGNSTTCTIQGFVMCLGQLFVVSSTVSLSIFYMCTIRFNMTDATAKRILEPILLMYVLLQSVPLSVFFLSNDFFNPQPHDFVCSIANYPKGCEGEQCIRGNVSPATKKLTRLLLEVGMASCLLAVFVSMLLVISKVFKYESPSRSHQGVPGSAAEKSNGERESGLDEEDSIVTSHTQSKRDEEHNSTKQSQILFCCGKLDQTTRSVMQLALMYIAAFWLTWLIPLISFFYEDSVPIQVLKCILLPSQGFFNAMIL